MQVAEHELQLAELKFDRSKWKPVRFDQMAQNITDRVDNPAEAGVDRYVGLEHLDPQSLKLVRWGSPTDVEATKLRFKPGDIIFGKRRAYQRKLAVADFEGICSAHAMVLRAREEIVLPEYLPIFMQSEYFVETALRISVGGLSPTINWRDLARQEFTLPTKDDQRRIAELLFGAETAIQEYRSSAGRCNAAKRALISRQTESCQSISCAELLQGKPRNGLSPKNVGSTAPRRSLSIGCVRDNRIDFASAEKTTNFASDLADRFVVQEGDFLVVRGNGNRNLCGRGGLANDPPPGVVYGDLLIRLQFDRHKILPELAAEIWNDEAVHSRLLSKAKSTNGIYKINGQDILSHCLPTPHPDEQPELLRQLWEMNQSKLEIDSQILRLAHLRAACEQQIWRVSADV